MSPIGPENFQRLEDFPSFISCIKCFGKPIIPPLLTPIDRHELKQLRIAATIKEAEIQRRKNEYLEQRQAVHVFSETHRNDYGSDFQSSMPQSCALWYPSCKDNQEGISVAISKFPTSGIYSSVHTGAIVCSNVIENSHAYASRTVKDSLFDSETNVTECVECSHNNINLQCSLCLAEYNQSFHDRSFTSEISPEVPCRTFSLLQQNVGVLDEELNSGVEETECESLSTVICNQKSIPHDTDSESNTTCMTQSTDLEKYMEFSCEFNSPDNSAVVWDSKSTNQQYTLSRSDDASSETIVNTENELTPCASTMAELTDNIEDELSNAEEAAGVCDDKEVIPGPLKRAHSVDSYMKILHTCARSMNVKKSQSEPFYTNPDTNSGIVNDTKTPVSFKTGLLIKEDSKESEESKDVPEKDVSIHENKGEISVKNDEVANLKTDDSSSFQKRHVRQNSYTLDRPSSVLILAHADCTCNFDAKCLSPHCSALQDENGEASNFAFTKERVDISVPVSHDQMKKLPILTNENLSECVTLNNENVMSAVVDIFPVLKEDSCEKSNSGNTKVSESVTVSESISTVENKDTLNLDEEKHLSKMFSDGLKMSNEDAGNQDYFKKIYQELTDSYEMRVKELFEEQNRQWLNLQEEFKVQEKLLVKQLSSTLMSSTGLPSKGEEKDQMKSNINFNSEKTSEDKSVFKKEELRTSNSSFSSDQIPTPDNSIIQDSTLTVSSGSPLSACSASKTSVLLQNTRASISPSKECRSPNYSPSISLENIRTTQLFKDAHVPVANDFKSNEEQIYSNSDSMKNLNGFPFTTSTVSHHSNSLPKSPNSIAVPDQRHDKIPVCFCANSDEQCKCCASFNGYCEYDISNSSPEYSTRQNSVLNSEHPNNCSDLQYSPNFSSISGVQSKNVSPDDFTNCHTFTNSRKTIIDSSRKSNDCVSTTLNGTATPFDNVEPRSVNNSEKRNISPLCLKEKSNLSLDSIVSLCAKTLKNGTCTPRDATCNKRIVDDPVLLKKFEKLPAFVKGYLTRRLFETERVQSLIKTLKDTVILIGKLSEELAAKGDIVCKSDVDFHKQLMIQLMTTFQNFYDIFCTISTKARMNIIAESRNFRLQQKQILKQDQESLLPVTTKVPDPAPYKKHKLSAATLKALERKKRSVIDSRTYTLEDFKNARSRSVIDMRTYTIDDLPTFRGRVHSSMSSKNLSVSPSSFYKTSVGTSLKRKTASAKSSGSRRCLHHWVP